MHNKQQLIFSLRQLLTQAEYSQSCHSEDCDVHFKASEIMDYYSTQQTFYQKNKRAGDTIFLFLLKVNMPLRRISHQGLSAQYPRSSQWQLYSKKHQNQTGKGSRWEHICPSVLASTGLLIKHRSFLFPSAHGLYPALLLSKYNLWQALRETADKIHAATARDAFQRARPRQGSGFPSPPPPTYFPAVTPQR